MLHVASMRSTAVLLLIALCSRVDAYRLHAFPKTPSTPAGRSRFESRRHHHDSSCATSARQGSNLGDKIDDCASSTRRTRQCTTIVSLTTKLRRQPGVAMSIVSNCLDYARERPRLVVGAFCTATATATASFLSSRCGDLPRRFKAPFMFLAVAAAGICVAPDAAVAKMVDAGVVIPATQSLWLFGLALFVAVAVRLLTSPAGVSTKGLTSVTGIGVALPYRGTRRCVYLDYNATSPIFPEVSREMFPFIGECFGNPSSAHALGRACKAAVVKARERVAALLGCTSEEVLFVASGSEADNHAILAALALHAKASTPPDGGSAALKPHVVSSAIEHPAITKCLDHLASEGRLDVTYVGVDEEGRVSIDEVAAALRPETALVTIMHSNNEVGSLQPIKEIAELCRRRGIMCHTDAAQSIGKVSVKVSDLGVDMLTLVGHKFGAPKGVAALFVRKGLALPPMIHGGGQEAGRRAGTENVLLISGMGKAAEIVDLELERLSKHLADMRARLLEHLEAADLGKGMRVHGPRDPSMRLPNTLSVGVPGLEARELLERLSETVAASAGSACHAGEATMSGVLQAMGVEESTGFGTIRLSVGRHTTRREVDRAAAAIVREARSMLAALELAR